MSNLLRSYLPNISDVKTVMFFSSFKKKLLFCTSSQNKNLLNLISIYQSQIQNKHTDVTPSLIYLNIFNTLRYFIVFVDYSFMLIYICVLC